WYRARGSVADQGKRAVAWKTGKMFQPDNLFFRTVDTGRLLPMALADFRVQLYAVESHWVFVETQKPKDQFAQETMHGLVLLRNVHDYGGADMPIIIVNWQTPIVEAALDYWVESSKNQWSEAERAKQFASMHPGLNPCLYQVDRCVRSLLRGDDPDVGYVAPVIVFSRVQPTNMLIQTSGKCFPLFTRASHALPGLESFPTTCGAPQCDEPDCGYWNMKAARSLHSPSPMVGKPSRKDDRVVCNLWGCEVQHTETTKLQQCIKCKEVLYCSRPHQ
ncbi:hypothetical protein BDZ89DRAFT_911643, partial [Hymenopellis radicata]